MTLHKYLYANMVDPTGNFADLRSFAVATTVAGALAVSYQVSISFSSLFDLSNETEFTDRDIGILTLASSSPLLAVTLFSLTNEKVDTGAASDVDQVVPLFRSVGNTELAAIRACSFKCFSLGPLAFPKQFWFDPFQAELFGGRFIKGIKGAANYHIVSTVISQRFLSTLEPFFNEPGIGAFVTVPNNLLPAFNAEIQRLGGIQYLGKFD